MLLWSEGGGCFMSNIRARRNRFLHGRWTPIHRQVRVPHLLARGLSHHVCKGWLSLCTCCVHVCVFVSCPCISCVSIYARTHTHAHTHTHTHTQLEACVCVRRGWGVAAGAPQGRTCGERLTMCGDVCCGWGGADCDGAHQRRRVAQATSDHVQRAQGSRHGYSDSAKVGNAGLPRHQLPPHP